MMLFLSRNKTVDSALKPLTKIAHTLDVIATREAAKADNAERVAEAAKAESIRAVNRRNKLADLFD
jgi:hypothetical protein